MRPLSFVALAACAFALPLACSEQIVQVAAPGDGTPDAGTLEEASPITPDDVPAIALEADPATDCPSPYQGRAPAAGENGDYLVAGQQRNFVLLLPDDTSAPRPLFVAFNGTGESGASFAARAQLEDFAARGFVVIAPSSAGNGENWPVWDALRQPGKENEPNKDLEYFDSVVKCVAAHHPVDRNRIYVGGHSAGGIFTNHVLQRRSQLLAGGIPASGIMSLTSPTPAAPLEPLFVIVTWGGDNDRYTGTAGGVSVGGFDFVTEASLASQFYDAQEKVGEVNCRGANVGHAWLSTLNGWFADQLLAHPKGLPGKGSPDLAPPVPANAKATCVDKPYAGPNVLDVACGASTRAGCDSVCQLFGDCAVENGTVGPVLKRELASLGFSGTKNAECGGCVAKCEQEATTASDAAALACFRTRQATAQCTQGINGAYPLIDAVNACCQGRKDSPYCVSICTEIVKNTTAASFFDTCVAITQ